MRRKGTYRDLCRDLHPAVPPEVRLGSDLDRRRSGRVRPTADAGLRLSLRSKRVRSSHAKCTFFLPACGPEPRISEGTRVRRGAAALAAGCTALSDESGFPMPLPNGKPTVEASLCSPAHRRRQHVSIALLQRYGPGSFLLLRGRKAVEGVWVALPGYAAWCDAVSGSRGF